MKRHDGKRSSGATATQESMLQSAGRSAVELVKTLGPAILIALVVRSTVVQAFWVPSGSMLPTIQIGDHIFVNKLAYTVRMPLTETPITEVQPPQRGDVVVFVSPRDPKTDLIKRVIGIPGDTIEIKKKKLYVNGEEVSDEHAHFEEPPIKTKRDFHPPVTVPEGKFFVMGDNRDRSYDSRFWGFADIADVKGRATFVYWSRDSASCWNQIRDNGISGIASAACLPRWRRFGLYIH